MLDGNDSIARCLPNLDATRRFGRQVASELFPGAVVALIGALGAGKTQLTQAIAGALGVANERLVTSPTFVLIQEYQARWPIFHFDAYRLNSSAEFEELGVDEYYQAGGVCLIEWADRVLPQLPSEHLRIELRVVDANSRHVLIDGRGERYGRIAERLRSPGDGATSDARGEAQSHSPKNERT